MKRLILSAAALAVSAGLAMAQGHTVRMGTEGAYPPYNFINDAGQVDGFERELGDKLCEMTKLTCEWVTNDWDSIIPNLVSGNYDTIIAGMSITDERDKVIDFTQPYIPPAASAYVAAKADADVMTRGDLGADRDDPGRHVAESGATLMEFATADETVAAVRNGEADAVFADKDYLVPIVAESGGDADVRRRGHVARRRRRHGPARVGRRAEGQVRRRDPAMKADGSLNAMIKKWFGDDAATW